MVARALAIVHTCIYDAWTAYDERALGTQLGDSLRRPASERTIANKQKAISFAAYRALNDLFPAYRYTIFDPVMEQLGYQSNDHSLDRSNPGNACGLGYGYEYTYIYTVYTHPDKTAIDNTLEGTPTSESFSPTSIACGNITGDGALEPDATLHDTIAVCSSSPIPTCSSTNTQTIKVNGVSVRTNTLTITNTGLTYVSNGPTQ